MENRGYVIAQQQMEERMADTRQENKSHQKAEEAFRGVGEQAADQTRRVGQTAAKAGEDLSRVSADLLRQNTEMLQNTWRFGMEAATAVMNRSSDQLGRTFGWTGDEAQQAAERSVRNTQTVMDSAAAISQGVNEISREYFQFARHQIEKNMERMSELWRCRTPHELAAVQSDVLRETMTGALESSRRLADMSLKVADDAGRRIAGKMQRAA
jgi:phasin family protein